MFVVVKSNMFTIIRINVRGCDDWYTRIEVIGIDHGWSMMKSVSEVFVTGRK